MAIIDKMYLKNASGEETQYDIGASADNVAYDNSTSIKSKVDNVNSVLETHAGANVVSSTGAHNIRYYQDKLQVKNGTWIDVISPGGNTKSADVIGAKAEGSGQNVTFTWSDSNDSQQKQTKLVKKTGSAPETVDETGVTAVVANSIQNQYSSTGYTDTNLTYETVYYYRFFIGLDTNGSGSIDTQVPGTGIMIKLSPPVTYGDMLKSTYDPDNDGIIGIAQGGTGNTDGYIRAGKKSGTGNSYYNTIEGVNNTGLGMYSHVEGQNNTITIQGTSAHAEGVSTTVQAANCHTEGSGTIASSNAAHAEGYQTSAGGIAAHAEGYQTTVTNEASHAEGRGTIADGVYSHAEGYSTTATDYAHAEGSLTYAGSGGHSEGDHTTARGSGSHAEGQNTYAAAKAHAEGQNTYAEGTQSHAGGINISANSDADFIHGIGKGESEKLGSVGSAASSFIFGNTKISKFSNLANFPHGSGFVFGMRMEPDVKTTSGENTQAGEYGSSGELYNQGAKVQMHLDTQGLYMLFIASYTVSDGKFYSGGVYYIVAGDCSGYDYSSPDLLTKIPLSTQGTVNNIVLKGSILVIESLGSAYATQTNLIRVA